MMRIQRPSAREGRCRALACLSALSFLGFSLVFSSPAPAVLAMCDFSAFTGQPWPGGIHRTNVASLSTSPVAPNGDSGWFRGAAPTVTLTAVDPEDSAFILYDWGVDPPATVYAGTFTAPSGQNTLYLRSIDLISNAETVTSQLFKVDTGVAVPVVVTPLGVGAAPAPVQGTIDIAATAIDAVSGVHFVSFFYYDSVGGAWNPVGTSIGSHQTAPVSGSAYRESWNTTLVPDGDYKLQVQVRDVAGNTAFSTPVFVRVDNFAPTASTADPAG